MSKSLALLFLLTSCWGPQYDPFHVPVGIENREHFKHLCLKYEQCIPDAFILKYVDIEKCINTYFEVTKASKSSGASHCTVAAIDQCFEDISSTSCDKITYPGSIDNNYETCARCFKVHAK